jgi:hypothetical protein
MSYLIQNTLLGIIYNTRPISFQEALHRTIYRFSFVSRWPMAQDPHPAGYTNLFSCIRCMTLGFAIPIIVLLEFIIQKQVISSSKVQTLFNTSNYLEICFNKRE